MAKKSAALVGLSNVKLSSAFDAEEARLRALAVARGSKPQPDVFGAPAAAAAAPARGRVKRPGPAPLSTPRFHPLPATPAPRVPKPAPRSRVAAATSGLGAAAFLPALQEELEAAAAAQPQQASGLTEYERQRSAKMQRNHTLLTGLNIPQLCAPLSIRVQEAREVQVMNFFPGVPSEEDVESGTIMLLSSEPIPARIFVSPVCPPAETAFGGRSAPQSPNASPSRSFRRRPERRGRRPTPPGLKAEAQRPPHCPSTHTHYRRHRCRHECGQRRAPRLRHREGAVPSPAH
jgi:hypothetical protein